MIVRAMMGATIKITKIKIGSGEKPIDYRKLDDLVRPEAEITAGLAALEPGASVTVQGTMRNSDIQKGFNWTEIGVFCENPDGGNDVIYAYGHYQIVDEGDEAGTTFVPKYSSERIEIKFEINVSFE